MALRCVYLNILMNFDEGIVLERIQEVCSILCANPTARAKDRPHTLNLNPSWTSVKPINYYSISQPTLIKLLVGSQPFFLGHKQLSTFYLILELFQTNF